MLTAGFPWPTILWIIFLDETMIVSGLVGALVRSRYKFGELDAKNNTSNR
jgi:bacteriorhodopsin